MALAAQVSLTARLPCVPRARVQAARRCCAGRALAVRVRAEAKSDDGLVSRAVNWLSVAVKNSPANSVKQAIAKAQAGDYDEKAVAARLESYINDHKVVVFSWTACPFCKKAKALLRDLGTDFTAVELDQMGSEGSALRCELARITERTSMPNIFIDRQPVGGCNDGPGIMTLHQRGQLEPMLKAAGAL